MSWSSTAGSKRSQSHVYGVSHHAHAWLHRPSRTNPQRRPIDGPSPWTVGPKHSLTINWPLTSASHQRRVGDACFGKPFGAQATGVALAAGRVATQVAGPRQLERCAEVDSEAHDVGLRHVDQRRSHLNGPTLHAALECQRRGAAERVDEL